MSENSSSVVPEKTTSGSEKLPLTYFTTFGNRNADQLLDCLNVKNLLLKCPVYLRSNQCFKSIAHCNKTQLRS